MSYVDSITFENCGGNLGMPNTMELNLSKKLGFSKVKKEL